jgi:hypothetical protein
VKNKQARGGGGLNVAEPCKRCENDGKHTHSCYKIYLLVQDMP